MSSPFQVVRDFEAALCEYTGAPFAVTTTSCTDALKLAVAWHLRNGTSCPNCGITAEQIQRAGGHLCDREPCGHRHIQKREIEIPKRTYVGVPMAIIHAGGRPTFREEKWEGAYRLDPLPVWDSARWFSGEMYATQSSGYLKNTQEFIRAKEGTNAGQMICVSFHWAKTLGIQQGGAILHDDPEADRWLRMARFDGRQEGVAPKDQKDWIIGHHCYMAPETAAAGLVRLRNLPRHNEPLPWGPGTDSDYPDLSTLEIFR